MTIKDRGAKKWTSIFLPEHLSLLREFWEDNEKVSRPELDEHAIEEIEQLIREAMEGNVELTFTTWKNGYFQETSGFIHQIDPVNRKLKIIDSKEYITYLPFYNVVAVRRND